MYDIVVMEKFESLEHLERVPFHKKFFEPFVDVEVFLDGAGSYLKYKLYLSIG